MTLKKILFFLSLILCFVISINLFAKELSKTFSAKKELEIHCVLGSCEIIKSKDNNIHVDLEYSYDDVNFTPKFREKTNKLVIEEIIEGDNVDGHSNWVISVPDGLEIEFESATGGLSVKGIKADFEGSSGTGSIYVENCKGEFDLNSGTGRVQVSDSNGEFKLNSGTGSVNVENSTGEFEANSGVGKVKGKNLTINDSADFNSGTGSVEVTNISGKDFDLSLNSGTGNVALDLDGQKVEGEYVFSTLARIGKISCPFEFDSEEKYWDGDTERIKKTLIIGDSQTYISISTGTGRAKLYK